MTDARTQSSSPEHRGSRSAARGDDLRRMVLLLETADVLERRARRGTDHAQIAVLLRRAEQRRREAARLREDLAARGAALAAPPAEQPPGRPAVFSRPSSGRLRRESGSAP